MNFNSPFPRAFFVFGKHTYRWSGWLGCQLESMERRRVPAGTTRRLPFWSDGHGPQDITVVRSERNHFWQRWRTTWTIPLHCDLDEANKRLHEFRQRLRDLI